MADKSAVHASPLLEVSEKQRQEDEWKQELLQLEKEIQTLKSVLTVKSAEASELRNRLGMSSIKDLKEDVKHSYKLLQDSEVVQKTSAAFKSLGEFASKKFDDIKNSNAVKTLEDKVGSAYSNVKNRLSSSSPFPSQATEGTVPPADSDLYSPTTTVDQGYEMIDESSLTKTDEDKLVSSGRKI